MADRTAQERVLKRLVMGGLRVSEADGLIRSYRREVLAEASEAKAKRSCDRCGGDLGARWWQDVPGYGDLCSECHGKLISKRNATQTTSAVGKRGEV